MSEVIINNNDWLKITHPPPEEGGSGQVVYVRIKNTNIGVSTNPNNTSSLSYSDTIGLDVFNSLGMMRTLNWHNCYSFGNGVESNRVADVFNMPRVTPGVKVSTVFEEYKEEHRKYGLIYSGIYNSTSGVNNLNQFVQAEKITKDINPIYGSIQKLHTRDTDLITLCEDKVLRILANKDAVYNADGNAQLTANMNVLGQAVPFVGEFGISKNPESFVSEAYRSYFTDKQRGAVMRLSRDGLTPISMHGMKDWFRDNLSANRVNLLGEDNLNWGKSNWDRHVGLTANLHIENGVAILGYYNDDIESDKYGLSAKLGKNGVLTVGKKYRFQFDTTTHSGLKRETLLSSTGGIPMMQEYPAITIQHGWNPTVVAENWRSYLDNYHVVMEFIAESEDFEINIKHVNSTSPVGYYTPPGGSQQTITSWVEEQRAGYPSLHNPYVYGGNYLYGATVGIKNLVLEEIKVEPKIVGSYDDRQDEYNVTIRGATWKTLSFREDVTGWVSFKSFVPENAISCANDYYTIKDGKLWQHHVAGVNNNTFYGEQTNSSLNVIFNDAPGSVKSFHALDYEGSQSRVEGIKTVEVIGVNPVYDASGTEFYTTDIGEYFVFTEEEMLGIFPQYELNLLNPLLRIKQYRNNILIFQGEIDINGTWGSPNPHARRASGSGAGDWQVGDIITTEEQEKTVNHFNSMPKDGWWVSGIETDKQKGSLPEFIEKEGKWFNHIKGIDSDIDETTNFGSFDIQGIGFLKQTITAENWQEWINLDPRYDEIWALPHGWDWINNVMEFDNPVNASLQIGDTIYYSMPSRGLGSELLENGDFSEGGSGWTSQGVKDFTTNPGSVIIGDNTATYSAIKQNDVLTIGREYEVKVEVLATSQPSASWPYISINNNDDNDTYSANYHYIGNDVGSFTYRWKANVTNFELYVSGFPIYGETMEVDNVSVRGLQTAEIFGFTRLEAENMVKFGKVTNITQNTITVDETVFPESPGGTPDPTHGAFILFAKNQVVNTSSLLGYYADVKLENNSKNKAEIFSLSSEITESSK